jgi:endonuclease/exonuclease/phosphatase family metal-dependent hydrolase
MSLAFTSSFSQSLKVMTYNIRVDTPVDSVNRWPNRVDKVVALINKYDPDIIGVQEALHHQLQDLLKLLPNYSFCGVGRDDGKELGEYSAILFRNSRFGMLANETWWLSETPEVPGSISWDAAMTRVVTSARFYDKELKKEFVVFNTHFDHLGKAARSASAAYIASSVNSLRLNSKNIPVVVAGDFNCERTEESYTALLASNDLIDTKPVNNQTGTFCGFEVGKMECLSFDYIFHTHEWVLKNYRIITDNDGKYYPSDHLPVLVELELSAGD